MTKKTILETYQTDRKDKTMFKATFNGGYKDFTETHKSIDDIKLRANALNWTIVSIEEVK